jgi:hypothetical protein
LRIKRTLQYRAGGIANSCQLFDAILNIWQNFTVEYVQNLNQSIPLALAILNLGKSKISSNNLPLILRKVAFGSYTS